MHLRVILLVTFRSLLTCVTKLISRIQLYESFLKFARTLASIFWNVVAGLSCILGN